MTRTLTWYVLIHMLTELLAYSVLLVPLAVALVWLIYWIGQMQEHRGTVATFMKEIRDQLKEIFLRLPATSTPVASRSPLQLNDFGHKMADTMDATAWAASIVPTLQADLAGKRSFEIDAASREYVQANMQKDERVSKCMYETGVDCDSALKVLQVVLRDALLKSLGLPTETTTPAQPKEK